MPTPMIGALERAPMTLNGNRNRHNPGLEMPVRLRRQDDAIPVIQSQGKREFSCKIKGGRKGPVNRLTISRAVLAYALLFAGAASAADVHTQPQFDLRAEQ